MYKGKLIRLKIDGDYIPCELSCEINVNQEVLPVTNNTQGRAKSFIRGYYEWSVTLESNFTSINNKSASQILLGKILLDGDGSVGLEIVSHDTSGMPFILMGNVIPTTWNLSAGASGLATNNTTFQGNGELILSYDAFWNIINAMPADAEKPNIVDTTEW